MNVTALTARYFAEKPAGNYAPKAASMDAAPPQASAIVSLSGGGQTAPLTYASSASRTPLLDATLLLPTRANAARLAFEAGEAIGAKLDAAGITREPGFQVTIEDPNSAHVTVKGDRADAKAIEDLINADPKLQMAVHNAYAIASHIPSIDRALQYDKEYRAARTPAEIDRVNARYADLLGGRLPPTSIEMDFAKDGLSILINGEKAQA
ncbi:MAG TPA: hypothetical protein VF801_02265 [Rhodocyclaceae bacterium]